MIFQREWKRNRKALIIWSVILGGLIVGLLSMFPQFAEQQESLSKMMEAYPESMQKAFGMDELGFGTLMGFYGIEVHMMTTLLGSIYAAMLASNILAKEENEKTIEFLLSKPITRNQIVAQKLAAVIINLLILNGIAVIASLVGFQFAEGHDVPYKTFALLVIATILLHFTFAAISFMLSSMMRKTRNILSISIAVVIIAYFFNMMSGLSADLDVLKYFSPFNYADAANIINEGAIKALYVAIMAAVILLTVFAAFIVYKKKDISV
ncbi:ABC transporter permease subunit [Bacillus aerolatus]|uniref:ABC transporter permease subunit n=1 Tax=Bacillus aerolatus TaxID=2653354 RepID=A0A6I1FGD3_9BACI|nr:ABC transporter permease subunit [Bacillus aerolatus]KAB7707244.1 ABC transporter permease subunit [Bacillus aerolatus]